MAYQRFNQNDMSFIADTKEDLKTLPKCSMGSTCYIIDEARKYMMNSKGEWIPQEPGTNNNTGGGNNGSGGNNVDLEGYLTEEEAKEIYQAIKLPKRATKGSAGYDYFSPIKFISA